MNNSMILRELQILRESDCSWNKNRKCNTWLLILILFLSSLYAYPIHSQSIQSNSVFSNSGHVIGGVDNGSIILGTLGHPLIGLSQGNSDRNRAGFLPTKPRSLTSISLQVITVPVTSIPITGSHPGTTNYPILFDEPTTVSITVPQAVEGCNFIAWFIDGQALDSNLELTILVDNEIEAIAVYETRWFFEPGWNLISTPFNLDNTSQNTLNNIRNAPIWQWSGANFNTAKKIFPGSGYWFYKENAMELKPSGNPPLQDQIELGQGWNLIGIQEYQFVTPARISNLDLGSTIWGWNAGSQKYFFIQDKSLPSFQQGRLFSGAGYWIHKK